MSVFALMASFVIDTAGAPLRIENCVLHEDARAFSTIWADCDYTNIGETAIASILFSSESKDEARTVPWDIETGFRTVVPGGIEPGETVNHLMPFPSVPERAKFETLVLRAFNFRAFDVDDNEIVHQE